VMQFLLLRESSTDSKAAASFGTGTIPL